MTRDAITASALLLLVLLGPVVAETADVPLIRLGYSVAAEEQLWLMAARPDLTPNQGKKYRLKLILFQNSPESIQAYLAGELDGSTASAVGQIFAKAQGVDIKMVASICQEAAGREWFSSTFMVKDDGPIRAVGDLKGRTLGVVGIKTATDLWARAALVNAGLVPDKDVKLVPLTFSAMGDAIRTEKVAAGVFPEPFYSAESRKGGLRKLFTVSEAMGYGHDLIGLYFGERFLKAQPDVVRAFLEDFVAATKYYLANKEQARRDVHRAGFVRTPVDLYLQTADWRRDPQGRPDVASLRKLAGLMHEKLGWLEKPVNVDELVDPSYLPK